MANKKVTRDQLIVKVSELDQSNVAYAAANERRLKEFAKAFGWKKNSSYNSENDPIIPSWEQVFVKIGELLAANTFVNLLSDLHRLEDKINSVENQVGDFHELLLKIKEDN